MQAPYRAGARQGGLGVLGDDVRGAGESLRAGHVGFRLATGLAVIAVLAAGVVVVAADHDVALKARRWRRRSRARELAASV